MFAFRRQTAYSWGVHGRFPGLPDYETIRWEQSWLHCSTVHERLRQEAIHFSVLVAPSCQMNRNWPYRYRNWCTRLQYTFRGKSISVRVYAIDDTHWVFFGFSYPRNRSRYIFFEPCEVPIVFPLSVSLDSVAFSLVGLQNVFQLTTSGMKTDASSWLLSSDLFRTYS